MIEGLVNSGAMPVLERLVQFTEARHGALTHSIANLSTPFFKPVDLSVASFRQSLHRAIDQRRAGGDPASSPLPLRATRQLDVQSDRMVARPGRTNDGVLFHDQNNRDLERFMQHLAENSLTHRMGIDLLRSELATLQVAIRERV